MGWVKGPAFRQPSGIYGTTTPGPTSTHMWATAQGLACPAIDRPIHQFWMFGGRVDLGGPTATAYITTYGDTCPPNFPSQNKGDSGSRLLIWNVSLYLRALRVGAFSIAGRLCRNCPC